MMMIAPKKLYFAMPSSAKCSVAAFGGESCV